MTQYGVAVRIGPTQQVSLAGPFRSLAAAYTVRDRFDKLDEDLDVDPPLSPEVIPFEDWRDIKRQVEAANA